MWRWAGIDSRPWGVLQRRVSQFNIPFPLFLRRPRQRPASHNIYEGIASLLTSTPVFVYPNPTSIRTSIDCIASSHLMRRTSVSLPTRNVAYDPHEKPARYNKGANTSAAATLEKIKIAWMTQSQRSRYLKTGGVLLLVVFLFYYLSPRGTDIYTGGRTRINPSLKLSNTSVQ